MQLDEVRDMRRHKEIMYSKADAKDFDAVIRGETVAFAKMVAMIGDDISDDVESEAADVKKQNLQNALTIYNRSSELLSSVHSALVISKANDSRVDLPTPHSRTSSSQPTPQTPQDVFVDNDDRDDTAKTMTCVQFLALLLITLQRQQTAILTLLPTITQGAQSRIIMSTGGKGKYKSRKMRKMRKISRNRRRSNRKSVRSTRKKQKYVKRYSMYKRY